MIRIMVLSAALLLVGVSALFAQDPGMPDSLIIACLPDHVDSSNSYQFCFARLCAVTDDSVTYFNLPLAWIAPLGGIMVGPGTIYDWPLNAWDVIFDTVMANESRIRLFGFCSTESDTCEYPLFTDGERFHFASLRLIVAPNTPSQLVVIDTFAAVPGFSFSAFQRGFLSIGSVGIDPDDRIPGEFSLCQNYPNPFNASATIEYSLHYGGPVRLEVFDLLGRRVATLIDGVSSPGAYAIQWQGRDDGGNGVPSGVYFYRLSAGGFVETKRMLLLK